MRGSSLAATLLLLAGPAAAADTALAFDHAWAAPAAQGADTTLYLTANNAAAEDAIIRVRCDAANFTEFHTLDRGEGVPSARLVKAIPLAANGRTTLNPDGFSIRLLQLTHSIAPGDTFDCALRLRSGSQASVAVSVAAGPPDAAR